MINILLLGLLAMVACLALEVVTVALAVRYFSHVKVRPLAESGVQSALVEVSVLMIVLMLGILVQVMVWAAIYLAAGRFNDIETAFYFSGVTFTSLGYGDVVLTGDLRLLAPLEAANGMMMFGISTAAFITAIQQAIARHVRERSGVDDPTLSNGELRPKPDRN
jgi:hypothetical protein